MRKYMIIMLNQIVLQFHYRFDLVIGILTKVIQLAMTYFIWDSIYHFSTVVADYTREEMLSYIVLTNLTSIIFSFEYIFRLGALVRSGRLTTILLRPISLFYENFAMFTGSKLIFIIPFTGWFMYQCVVLGRYGTDTWLVILYVVLLFFMFFAFIACMSTIGFWFVQVWPLRPILNAVYLLFAGVYFPLDLLPEWLFRIVRFTPFSIIGYGTSNILQGNITDRMLFYYVIAVALWYVIFRQLYEHLLHQGLKKYEGMGS